MLVLECNTSVCLFGCLGYLLIRHCVAVLGLRWLAWKRFTNWCYVVDVLHAYYSSLFQACLLTVLLILIIIHARRCRVVCHLWNSSNTLVEMLHKLLHWSEWNMILWLKQWTGGRFFTVWF